MSSKTEHLRNLIIDSGSPIRNHGMNQQGIKFSIEGDEKLQEPRKVRIAAQKRRRLIDETEYQSAKVDRILKIVLAVKEGRYDCYCEIGFMNELRFLKNQGVLIKSSLPFQGGL